MMAGAGEMVVPANVMDFTRTAGGRKIMLMLGAAAVIAIMAAVWLWGQQPSYRVLFANFSDRDGGAIVAEPCSRTSATVTAERSSPSSRK